MTLNAHLLLRLSPRTNLFILSNGRPRPSWNISGRNPLEERKMAPPSVELRNGFMLNPYTACVSFGSRLVTFANPSVVAAAAGTSPPGLLPGAPATPAPGTGGVGAPAVPGLEVLVPAAGPGGVVVVFGVSLPPANNR